MSTELLETCRDFK